MRKTRLRKTRRKTQNQLSPLTPRRPMTVKAIIWSKADGINPGIVLPPSNSFNPISLVALHRSRKCVNNIEIYQYYIRSILIVSN